MNILLISECTKHALTETRRILDQFAERRGERTWQTPITEAGLNTLHKLLRKSARKNTAVACHWIRGRNYSELLWVVGDRNRFNHDGAVPTNTTKRDVLRSSNENEWRYGEDIRLLSGMAALLHDLGKSCKAFQDSLRRPINSLNMLRHEWISLRLFQAFVGCDDDITWLKRFQKPCEMQSSFWIQRLEAAKLRDGVDDKAISNKPLSDLPPLAASIGWLILTHHRLPLLSKDKVLNMHHIELLFNHIDVKWNNLHSPNWLNQFERATKQAIESYWTFDCDLPINDSVWQKYANKLASRLEKRYQKIKWLDFPYIMHLSRLTLMLSDHYYSSLTKQSGHFDGQNSHPVFTKELYANKDKEGNFNQTLREHLVGVARHSDIVCHALPNFEYHLPGLLKCRKLHRRSADPYFNWQNKSAELAMSVREQSRKNGAFIVNMASTGCGKTLANARVMYELSDSKRGMRCVFALGLRTLTMQTGRIFREQLELREDQLEIMVGGSANRELFKFYANEAEKLGSESSQCLWDEQTNSNDSLSTTSNEDYHPLLVRLTKDARMRALLNVPLLVCTIDHIMPATESKRGGRQIIPMLRLMSSDLVLDEPDDFDLSDLPALSRLVYWSGLLGSRVLLSSATLPPTLVLGLFEAYLAGRHEYQLQREENTSSLQICCLWLDENQQHYAQCNSKEIFSKQHKRFSSERYTWLTDQSIRRTSRLIKFSVKFKENEVSLKQENKYLKYGIFNSNEVRFYFNLAHTIYSAAIQLHKENAEIDLISKKQVSFGLIRIANIEKLYKVALALYALEEMDDIRIHLCVYHSQYPLLLRSLIENQLDKTLDRKDPTAVFRLPDIQNKLQTSKETNQLFVVLGSPVTEVGRDHDYDWAIIEPSSMRSLIQLAGRVRRHRVAPYKNTNLLIFEQNIRSLREGGIAYCNPGFEQGNEHFRLKSHNLQDLLLEVDYKHLDARARIVEPQEITPEFAKTSLIGLEHACLRDTIYKNFIPMQPNPRRNSCHSIKSRVAISASTCWQMQHAMLSALLPEHQPFRQNNSSDEEILLLIDSNYEEIRCVKLIDDHKCSYKKCELLIKSLFNELPDDFLRSSNVTIWGQQSYLQALKKLSEEIGVSLDQCAHRYGVASVPKSEQGWFFHSALGFINKK